MVMMMQKRLAFLPLALLAMTAAPALAGARVEDRSPEARLTKALQGFEAGAPVRCIHQRDIRSTQIFDRTAILYDMGGGLRYLNRPRNGESSLRQGNVMVTDTRSPDLCSIDIVRMFDSSSRMSMGFVGLGEFVPYRKIKTPHR